MDPVTMMLAGTGVQLAAGGLGELLSGMDRAEAERLIRAAQNEYGEIDIPALEQLVAQQVGPSEQRNVQADPRLKQAQMNMLSRLKQMEDEGGLLLEDKAALNQVQNGLNRQASGQRQSILSNLQARGVAGAGEELSVALAGQQNAANRANEAGMNTAAAAQRRMYQSIMDRGREAGRQRDQDFGEQSRGAEAQDLINRYNAGLRQDADRFNVGQVQQQHQNRVQLADRKAQGYRDRASAKLGNANDTRQLWGGVGAAAAEGARTYGAYQSRNPYELADEETPAGRKARGY